MNLDTRKRKFWLKTTKLENGCLVWNGAKDKEGYGVVKRCGFSLRAHRYALELDGVYLGNKLVLHHCDNPSCVNPEHLWVGTQLENMRDKAMKDRAYKPDRKGESCPLSILTTAMVREIRALYPLITVNSLSTLFKIGSRNIYQIISRERWQHIPPLTEQEILEIRNKYASQYT